MAQEKPSKKDIEKKKADEREAALKSFKGAYTSLAAAYLVDKNKDYGEADNSAIDEYVYAPAMKTDEYAQLMRQSRQNGKRYSGSEFYVIETASKIIQSSLSKLKVTDILKLLGSKITVKDQYKDMYLADLSGDDGKKLAGMLMGSYLGYLTDTKVAEALTKRSKAQVGGLEGLLKKED